eukprot:7285103-Ditylum_brightwellii.AAC.1
MKWSQAREELLSASTGAVLTLLMPSQMITSKLPQQVVNTQKNMMFGNILRAKETNILRIWLQNINSFEHLQEQEHA